MGRTSRNIPRGPRRGAVNRKFIIIFTSMLLLIGTALVIRYRITARRREQQVVERAQANLAEGKYAEAATGFARASTKHPEDVALATKWGDALYQLSASHPEALKEAVAAWERALSTQPGNLDVLQRLLSLHAEMLDVRPTAATFQSLGDVAGRILRVAPSHRQAGVYQRVASLGPWLYGLPAREGSSDSARDTDIAALAGLVDQNAADGEALYFFARAQIHRAAELLKLEKSPEADAARAAIESKAIRAVDSPKADADTLFRAAQSFALLAFAHGTETKTPATVSSTQLASVPDAQRYAQQARQTIERARAAAAPADRHFLDIRLLEAELATTRGDRATAERLYREALVLRPGSLAVRLPLSRLLSPARAEEAVQLLDDLHDPSAIPGPRALSQSDLLGQAMVQKASVSLDACAGVEDPALLTARVARARSACDKAREVLGEQPLTLKLAARLNIQRGRFLDALGAAKRAAELAAKVGGAPDLELVYSKALALLGLRQLDEARAALREAVELDPGLGEHRLLLARILVEQGDLIGAADQAQILARQWGDDPRVASLWLVVLAAQQAAAADPQRGDRMKGFYASLPEADRTQRIEKARAAFQLRDWNEASRLLGVVLAGEPSSPSIAAALVRAMALGGQKEQALKVLGDALVKNPDRAELIALKKRIEAGVPADLEHDDPAAAAGDPLARALLEARTALARRDAAGVRKSLDQARAIKSDDPELMDVQFRCALLEKRWDEADTFLKKMSASNQDQMNGLSYRLDLARSRGDAAGSLATAREMTERYADFAGSWAALGEALLTGGRFELALKSFATALSLDANNLPSLRGAASCGLALGRTREAELWIARGRKLAPDDAEFRELELRVELLAGDPRRLIARYEEAMQREPARADNAVALARVYLAIGAAKGVSPADSAAALRRAGEILDQAVKQFPDEPAGYRWASVVASHRGDGDAGENLLRQLTTRDIWKSRPEPWLALVDYQLAAGRLDRAEAALREAVNRDAGTAAAMKLVRVLGNQGKWDAALEILGQYPSDPDAQLQRVLVLTNGKKAAQAEVEGRAAVDKEPKSAYRMALLGLVYANQQKDKPAMEWTERALALNPSEPLALRLHGQLSLRQSVPNIQGAIEDLSIAHDLNTGDIETSLLLAEAYDRKRDSWDAQAVLQQAMLLAPSDRRPRLRLIALYGSSATPNWDSVAHLIEEGRQLWPADVSWDASEARMWFARGDTVKAAAIMHRGLGTALSQVDAAATRPSSFFPVDGALSGDSAKAVRAMIREDLSMLVAAKDYQATLTEAEQLIARFGPADVASAWAHLARAMALRQTNPSDGTAATEMDAALVSAEAAGDCAAAIDVLAGITLEAGPREALRRLAGHGSAAKGGGTGPAAAVMADPRWDVLKIELLNQAGDTPAAVAAVDMLLPQIEKLPADYQVSLLRLAAELYGRAEPKPQFDKSRRAYQDLLERLPEDLWSLNNLAYLLLELINPPEPHDALKYSRRAYELMRRANAIDPGIADTYGWALVRTGHADEAMPVLKDVVQRLALPDTHYHLGEAYLAAAMPQEAQEQFEAAMELFARAEKEGRPVDTALRSRVDVARQRAAEKAAKVGAPSPGQALR